jgi:hypothetical protein
MMNDTTKADALDGIEPSAYQAKAKNRAIWTFCPKDSAEQELRRPAGRRTLDVRALYDRAAIEAAIERARADERNLCKQVCEAISDQYREREGLRYPEMRTDAETGAGECAAAIEALGTTGEQP